MTGPDAIIVPSRRVLLVIPAVEDDPFLSSSVNLGMGYIGASLLSRGHEVRLLDMGQGEDPWGRLSDQVRAFRPEVLGVSGSTFHYPSARAIVRHVKAMAPETLSVLGGSHASALAEYLLESEPQIDYVIRGEGERALPSLLACFADKTVPESVPGLVYRADGAVRANPAEAILDLDALDPPWRIIDPLAYQGRRVHGFVRRQQPVAQVLSSRGCPYQCTFCAGRCVLGSKMRMRSPASFVEELIHLRRAYGIREIQIVDDNFTFYRDHALEICDRIVAAKLGLTFSLPNGVRADRLDEGLLGRMKQAGFYYLSFGIEFGSPRMLKLCRKSLDLEQARESIRRANRLGFMTQGFFLLGHPEEKTEDMDLTASFIRSVPLDRILLTLPFPLPGSALFDYYIHKRYGSVDKVPWESLRFDSYERLFEYTTMEEVRRRRESIYRAFYLNPVNALRFLSKFRTVGQVKSAMAGLEFLRKLLKS